MNIIIAIEDKGIELNSLIEGRAPGAQRRGCLISASRLRGGQCANVVVTGCGGDHSAELRALCTVLADIIVENLQIRHMVRILKRSYCFLSEKDQCDVLVRVLRQLWYPQSGHGGGVATCKNDVKRRLLSALTENDAQSVVLEGFMRFRMKDYLQAWEQAVAHCVKDLIQKKEYLEFVEILRLFISIRVPRKHTVHLCADAGGQYVLLDDKLSLISHRDTFINARASKSTSDNVTDQDDVLLSALVNIAPQRIVIHNRERFPDPRIIETITDVFGKRVSFSGDMV